MHDLLKDDFATLFHFLDVQDKQILLYADDLSDEDKERIQRFITGRLTSEEEKELFFSTLKQNPQLLRELAKQIEESQNG